MKNSIGKVRRHTGVPIAVKPVEQRRHSDFSLDKQWDEFVLLEKLTSKMFPELKNNDTDLFEDPIELSNVAGGFVYELKTENHYLRWNLLWNLIFCVVLIPLPLWMAIACENAFVGSVYFYVTYGVNAWGIIVLLYVLIKGISTTAKLDWNVNHDITWIDKYPGSESSKHLRHVVLMCAYKEPLDLIFKSIGSLVQQTQAHKLIVVIGLEEKTPDVIQKKEKLEECFRNTFSVFMVTIHPQSFFPGEIPGKCSNANYAARKVVFYLLQRDELDLNALTVTSCDSDSVFHHRYFEFLGYEFLTREDAKVVTWQAPLFYHFNMDNRW